MSALLTEFTSLNDVALEQAYLKASRYVAELRPGVKILDLKTMGAEHRRAVVLAVYAASHVHIQDEPCLSVLREIVDRQLGNIGLSVGVAAMGDDGTVAKGLSAQLGHQPTGSSRWVVALDTPEALFDKMVEWLLYVIDVWSISSAGSSTLADESNRSIAANMDTGVGMQATERPFWGIR